MRKTILLLSLVATALTAGSAGARGSATTFTFCTDPSFPPMEYVRASGGLVGFDVDMASSLAKTFGATSKPLKTAFPGLIPALNSKKCDGVISGIFVTPDRLKQAGAVRYMETHRVFVVQAGNPKHVTGPSSLKGLNVVTQAGTKYEEYLKALQKKVSFNLQTYPGDNDAVAQVILGRADVDRLDWAVRAGSGQQPGHQLALHDRRRERERSVHHPSNGYRRHIPASDFSCERLYASRNERQLYRFTSSKRYSYCERLSARQRRLCGDQRW